MDYYGILGFGREPFSNTPDPDFFFRSEGHANCLNRLEIALRLRRGLNVVLGEVGLGKTTLCRQLLRCLDVEGIETHLILDPAFGSAAELLGQLHAMLTDAPAPPDASEWEIKERIKNTLFTKAVDQGRIVVLIVDEGQKISPECLELLRELLNYETNDAKLLQIVIFAQPEFDELLAAMRNVEDRINERILLEPLTLAQTTEMVRHRIDLAKAGYAEPIIFSRGAFAALHMATGGHPRKIINLCHKVILALILQNKTTADAAMVRSCARNMPRRHKRGLPRWAAAALVVIAIGAAMLAFPEVRRPMIERVNGWTEVAITTAPQLTADTTANGLERPHGTPALEGTLPAPAEATMSALPALRATPSPDGRDLAATGISQDTAATHPAPLPAQDMREDTAQDFEPPRQLGCIVVAPRDKLSLIMARVYGIYDTADLAHVLEANGQLRDPNVITPGSALRFPCVATYPAGEFSRHTWIELNRAGTLREAYALLPSAPDDCRILSHWTPREGLAFSVVLRDAFTSPVEARAAMARLPQSLRDNARLLDGKAENMVYLGGAGFSRSLGGSRPGA
ncbi:general secretion pathway protein A [Desulfobaculum xiamenense]|uniref:General secretion pathway protein A n=1 Tax=Desulfobaculum xiamenense TaxID=995050 RepID=A0A846QPZ3_9BACT|nr:AAA family ATPase [Desulfobaculum xiamenense]NJB68572.1 general secretion pathway protein A [Desulfobaculum xiamenense]